MATVKDDNYFLVYGWMTKHLQLSGTQLLVYALIYNFNKNTNSIFYGSNDYIKQWFGIGSRNTITAATRKLAEAKLIFKRQECFQGRLHNFYWINNEELPQGVAKVKLNNANMILSSQMLNALEASANNMPTSEEPQNLSITTSLNDEVTVKNLPPSAQNLGTNRSKCVHNNNSNNKIKIINKPISKQRRAGNSIDKKLAKSLYEEAVDFNAIYG